jgi:glycosyltransferase involved in cell wall biosynthesis
MTDPNLEIDWKRNRLLFHNTIVKKRISVIIPNHNGSRTIGKCLEALFSSDYDNFEVLVVDDASGDNSVAIIQRFPCRLVTLDSHAGASKARNTGARVGSGDLLFFIDADCVVERDTLSLVNRAAQGRQQVVCGGTYTKTAYDDTFFSTFQSVFIHYSETKKSEPDYIASHAMVIDRRTFEQSGGFPENFMPIIEDVEFSHRLKRTGIKLAMDPSILVRHIFNFTLLTSLRNAFRKSRYWTAYSLKNRDLLNDSGTASVELKTNVVSLFVGLAFILLAIAFRNGMFLFPAVLLFLLNISVNRNLFAAFYRAGGLTFALCAAFYYMLVYPVAVGAGSLAGMANYYLSPGEGAA